MTRRRLRLAVAFLTMLLAGCGGLPLSTSTTAVRAVSVGQVPEGADVPQRIPHGPETNASPRQVIAGFLAAGADPDVVREFLTPGNTWDPLAQTVVFGAVTSVSLTQDGGQASALATLSSDLTIADDGSTQPGNPAPTVMLHLIRVQGAWRIDRLPNGTLLQATDLASAYRQVEIAWLSPDRRSLVQESVLLPGDAETVIPDLVKTLFQGPLTRLAAAGVTSVLPSRLTVVRAVQQGTEIDIDMQGPGGAIAASDAAAARAQLAATMLSLPGVTSVRIDLSGQPLLLNVSGADTPITAADTVGFDRDVSNGSSPALVATATTVSALPVSALPVSPTPSPSVGVTVSPTPGASLIPGSKAVPTVPAPTSTASPPSLVAAPVVSLAVAADGQTVAELRSVDGQTQPVELDTPSSPPIALASPGRWTSVAWGSDATLWLVREGAVSVAIRDRTPVPVTMVPAMPLRSLLIEPDGVHALGITQSGGRLVAGLVNGGAQPPSLTDVHVVAPSLSKVTAMAISGDGVGGPEVIVSGTNGAATGIWRIDIGAPSLGLDLLSQVATPVAAACPRGRAPLSLAALPSRPVLAACGSASATDVFLLRSNGTWIDVRPGLAAYPTD